MIDDAYGPAIYGDKIVWLNIPGGTPKSTEENGDIYMYDFSTSTETRITTNDSEQLEPAIYGDRIVWTDWRNAVSYDDASDIYMYDLSNSEEIQITTAEEEQLAEVVETPVTDFTANITSGYAPLTVSFTYLSENATEWNWDFGDENTSIEQNPVHTYSTAGSYAVNLTVSSENGTDSKIATITVLAQPSNEGAAPFAYITNQDSNNVSVIDTATNTVTATVPVGHSPEGVAVSPDGTKVYVTSRLFSYVPGGWGDDDIEIETLVETGIVSVIDTATNNVTASVNVGVGPQGVAVSPDGTKVYVTNEGSDTGAISTVSVLTLQPILLQLL